ncbi:MAG: hypothetical protein NZM05_05300 [Chloroherpetonaceae bacterium]|nr:hypothetical protein [Chloroherpetonaceae bacterium]
MYTAAVAQAIECPEIQRLARVDRVVLGGILLHWAYLLTLCRYTCQIELKNYRSVALLLSGWKETVAR